MKISKQTFDVLKNFSEINENLLIKPGNKLQTISVMKNVLAEATVEETFDKEFAIYDLNSLLSVLSLYESPDVTLGDDFLTVSQGKSSSKFWYADPSLVVSPTKAITMPSAEVKVRITQSNYTDLLKASNIMQLPDVGLVSDGDTINLIATDKKNQTSNQFNVEVAEGNGTKFNFYFKRENLRMIPGEYDLIISQKNISHWINANKNLQYWVALETDSKYEG
tara:strand:+ start:1146 stop:1811 length:666 start_codon:yes stop_codon:yes gene_type:complete